MTDLPIAQPQPGLVPEVVGPGRSLLIPSPEMNPAAEIGLSSRAATACKAIVTATAVNISGRKYVKCEGWQAIAIAHGCIASSRDVQRVEGGISAIGEIRRRDTGQVIAEAEGFVGDDETMWAKRPEYARRAMAQTRAISRACRSAFAHVVVLMQAGLETTPAEEMPPERKAQRAQSVQANGAMPIDASDVKKLWTIATAAGHPHEEVKVWLWDRYKAKSSKDINTAQYHEICNRLADRAPLNEPQPPPPDMGDANEDIAY